MSMPISDRAGRAARIAACLVLPGVLAACGGIGPIGGPPAPAPANVAVTAERVVIAGPAGYCVDPTATRDADDTGFVVMGNCAAISNSRRADQPDTPAVLTAAVSAPSDGGRLADSLDELGDFFRSPDGLVLLSRAGDAGTVTILDSVVEGDVFLLHATDRSDGAIDGVQQDYWRAYLDVGSRIATLSVIALEDSTMSREDSLATLRDFVQAVQIANSATPDAPPVMRQPVAPVQSAPENLPLDSRPLFNVGLFRRILG